MAAQKGVAIRLPSHAAVMFRHGSQGLHLLFRLRSSSYGVQVAPAPPWDDER